MHFGVRDVDVENVGGRRALKLRFRVIKQDQRVERPEARGEGDWVYLGAVEKDGQSTKWCPLGWFLKLQRFHGARADKKAPLFLDPDMRRPLIYRKFGQQFKDLQARVGVAREDGSSQPGSDDSSHPQASTSVLHLTPGGTARPGGYWGSTSRPAPRSRSPMGRAPRRSPSRS